MDITDNPKYNIDTCSPNQTDKRPDLDRIGYRMAISEHLNESSSITRFKRIITSELQGKGISDWLYSSRPLPRPKTMAFQNLPTAEAAKQLHISRTAADKQRSKARLEFNTQTNFGSLVMALRQGYISLYE